MVAAALVVCSDFTQGRHLLWTQNDNDDDDQHHSNLDTQLKFDDMEAQCLANSLIDEVCVLSTQS